MRNKGVAIKAAAPKPSSTPTPEPKVEAKNLLASDSRITPSAALTAVDTCKTEDMTPDYLEGGATSHRNGFPRPTGSSYAKSSAKILAIPIIFDDRPFTFQKEQNSPSGTNDSEVLQKLIPAIKDA